MRAPTELDTAWMIEAYADYPATRKNGGYIAPTDVRDWVRRWIHRDDEICLVYDGVGFITYRTHPENMYAAIVDQIVVHPDHRRQGYANAMIEELTKILFEKGYLLAVFETLPGPIRAKYPNGVVTVYG